MPPESDDDRFLLDGKHGRFGFLRACREISDGLALLPLRDGLLADPMAPWRALSGSLDYFGIARLIAPVVVAQPCKTCPIAASFESCDKNAQTKLGTKHLGLVRPVLVRRSQSRPLPAIQGSPIAAARRTPLQVLQREN